MKKKAIAATIVAAGLASCTPSTTTNAVIGYGIIEEQTMTRSVKRSDILTIIETSLPSSLPLTITDEDGNTTTARTGQNVTLPVGTLHVAADHMPDGTPVVGTTTRLTREPRIVIDSDIDVVYNQTAYTVPATFACFAIAVDYSETASVTWSSTHGESGTANMARCYNAGLLFVCGDLTDYTLTVTLHPYAEGYEDTSFTFSTQYRADAVYAQSGKYYVMHPAAISSVGGVIEYDLSAWEGIEL